MKKYWLSIALLQTISLYSQEEMEHAVEPSPIDSRYTERIEEAAEIEHEEAERADTAVRRAFFKEHEHASHEAVRYADHIEKRAYDPSMIDVHIPDLRGPEVDMAANLRVDEAREVHAADRSTDALGDLLDHDVVVPHTTRMQDAINDVMRELRAELGPNLSKEDLEDIQQMVRDIGTYVHGEVGNMFNERLFKKSMKKLYKSIGKALVRAHADRKRDQVRNLKKKLKDDARQEEKAIIEQMRLEQLREMRDRR